MKRKDREINIFNISMLDVICGALGAFMIIMIILFPYYKKEGVDHSKEIKKLEDKIIELEQRALQAEKKLSKTFLLIYIRWSTIKQDIDLHVIDPAGNEFFYKRKKIAGVEGELSEDSQVGPGNEVWEIRTAAVGTYRLYANLYNMRDNYQIPTVKGRVFHRDGSITLPDITLTRQQEKIFIADIKVDSSGNVSIGN